jgi:hypothetical protein
MTLIEECLDFPTTLATRFFCCCDIESNRLGGMAYIRSIDNHFNFVLYFAGRFQGSTIARSSLLPLHYFQEPPELCHIPYCVVLTFW